MMQAMQKNSSIQIHENEMEAKFWEDKIEQVLNKITKVWFAGICIVAVPYFLYVCLQFFLQI
jgi:hypothetical protein